MIRTRPGMEDDGRPCFQFSSRSVVCIHAHVHVFFFRFFFLSFFPSNIQGVVRYERCYDRVLNHHCLHFHPRGDKKANQKYRWAGLL